MTINLGFANLTIDIIDDCTDPQFANAVIGLQNKSSGEYMQDIVVVRKSMPESTTSKDTKADTVTVYVYTDEYSEDYTHKFTIFPYKEENV